MQTGAAIQQQSFTQPGYPQQIQGYPQQADGYPQQVQGSYPQQQGYVEGGSGQQGYAQQGPPVSIQQAGVYPQGFYAQQGLARASRPGAPTSCKPTDKCFCIPFCCCPLPLDTAVLLFGIIFLLFNVPVLMILLWSMLSSSATVKGGILTNVPQGSQALLAVQCLLGTVYAASLLYGLSKHDPNTIKFAWRVNTVTIIFNVCTTLSGDSVGDFISNMIGIGVALYYNFVIWSYWQHLLDLNFAQSQRAPALQNVEVRPPG